MGRKPQSDKIKIKVGESSPKEPSEYRKHMGQFESKAEKKAIETPSAQDLAMQNHPKFAKFKASGEQK